MIQETDQHAAGNRSCTLNPTFNSLDSDSAVGEHCNTHADEAGDDRCQSTHHEGDEGQSGTARK